jgi:hypothetical protein
MNFVTSEFLLQNIWMVSYDHHKFDPKNHYIPTNPNYVGFQESKFFNLAVLSINRS